MRPTLGENLGQNLLPNQISAPGLRGFRIYSSLKIASLADFLSILIDEKPVP